MYSRLKKTNPNYSNVPCFFRWRFTCMIMLWGTSSVCPSFAQLTQNRVSNSPAAQWLQRHSVARTKSHLACFSTVLSRYVDLISCSADPGTRNPHLEILLEVTRIHGRTNPSPHQQLYPSTLITMYEWQSATWCDHLWTKPVVYKVLFNAE